MSLLPGLDKVAHFALYTVLGAALAYGRLRGRGVAGRLPHALLVVGGALYGASDEWHQSFVPGRSPSAADLAVDVGGVCAGYAAWLAWSRRASAGSANDDSTDIHRPQEWPNP